MTITDRPDLPEHIVEVDSVFGIMRAYRDDLITDQIVKFGNHTRPEFAFATCLLSPGMTCFDIGAHIGTFALTAARKVGSAGAVICVEANLRTFNILKQNVNRFRVRNIDIHNQLIGLPNVAYRAAAVAGNTGGWHLDTRKGGHGEAPAPTILLDDLIAKTAKPDLIKIDIEGLEQTAIESCAYIKRAKPILYLEISDSQLKRHGGSAASLEALLKSLGYEFFVNTGLRNGAHDIFTIGALQKLTERKKLFDVMCIAKGNKLLPVMRRHAVEHR